MFKKTGKGAKVGEINLVVARTNCGKSMYFFKELNKDKLAKNTEKHHKDAKTLDNQSKKPT